MKIWQEWITNNKLNKLNKTKVRNMNKKTKMQMIFMMRALIMTSILVRKNWMG